METTLQALGSYHVGRWRMIRHLQKISIPEVTSTKRLNNDKKICIRTNKQTNKQIRTHIIALGYTV
jgi:hypothetical protein